MVFTALQAASRDTLGDALLKSRSKEHSSSSGAGQGGAAQCSVGIKTMQGSGFSGNIQHQGYPRWKLMVEFWWKLLLPSLPVQLPKQSREAPGGLIQIRPKAFWVFMSVLFAQGIPLGAGEKPWGGPWQCLGKKGGDHPSMAPDTAFGARGTDGTRLEWATPKFKEFPASLLLPSPL